MLPMFSQQLIDYTQKQFSKPDLSTRLNTMVKQVNSKDILVQSKDKGLETIPYGMFLDCNERIREREVRILTLNHRQRTSRLGDWKCTPASYI